MPRLDKIDWAGVVGELDARGHALLRALLTPTQCGAIAARYDEE